MEANTKHNIPYNSDGLIAILLFAFVTNYIRFDPPSIIIVLLVPGLCLTEIT